MLDFQKAPPALLVTPRSAGMLSAPQKACVSVGHSGARGTAGSLVVVVDTEARLDHHVAVVVLVFAIFIYSGREQKRLFSPRGSQGQWEEEWEGTEPCLYVCQCACVCVCVMCTYVTQWKRSWKNL